METKRPQRHLTFEKRQKIEKLLNEGKTRKEIISSIPMSASGFFHELRRCDKGKYRAVDAEQYYIKTWSRRQNPSREISQQDVGIIRQMIFEGRSKSSIRTKLRCSYDYIERWFQENEPNYKGGLMENLEARLSNIEQQIEILLDIVKIKR
jgi:IS30 family transposase